MILVIMQTEMLGPLASAAPFKGSGRKVLIMEFMYRRCTNYTVVLRTYDYMGEVYICLKVDYYT